MSTAPPSSSPHFFSLRTLGDWLYNAAGHSDAGQECDLPYCHFRGQQLVEKRRCGRQEVHREWEHQDAVRPQLMNVVNNIFGYMGVKDSYSDKVMKRNFVNKLLCDKELVEALGPAKNIMEAENRDTEPSDLPEIYKLIGKGR